MKRAFGLILFAWFFLVFVIPLSAWVVICFTQSSVLSQILRVLVPGIVFIIFIYLWWCLVLHVTKSAINDFKIKFPAAKELIERLEREERHK